VGRKYTSVEIEFDVCVFFFLGRVVVWSSFNSVELRVSVCCVVESRALNEFDFGAHDQRLEQPHCSVQVRLRHSHLAEYCVCFDVPPRYKILWFTE
jgi:hypothetical protein